MPRRLEIIATATRPAENVITEFGEQLIVLGTVVGAIAALPPLIEFIIERRKRRERIALAIEDQAVSALKPNTAGFEGIFADIADLIDRCARPRLYDDLGVGNEVLILGPALCGKRSFAEQMARLARLDRLVTVWNLRNPEALSAAKGLVRRYSKRKLMLLLPHIDEAYRKQDDELLSELDALIETTAELDNVLVVGTATTFTPDGPLDNAFGIKLVLPGMQRSEVARRELPTDLPPVLRQVTQHYLGLAQSGGNVLSGITEEEFVQRVVAHVTNPAEVEDIVVLCRTAAMHRRSTGQTRELLITPEILEKSIRRVVVDVVAGETM